MKKILAILCAVLMLASLAAAASAEEAPQTTTITTTVPSTYVLTIPATVDPLRREERHHRQREGHRPYHERPVCQGHR